MTTKRRQLDQSLGLVMKDSEDLLKASMAKYCAAASCKEYGNVWCWRKNKGPVGNAGQLPRTFTAVTSSIVAIGKCLQDTIRRGP